MRVTPFIWIKRKKEFPVTAKEAQETLDFILERAKNAMEQRDFLRAEAYYRFLGRMSDDLGRLADELEILDNHQKKKEKA